LPASPPGGKFVTERYLGPQGRGGGIGYVVPYCERVRTKNPAPIQSYVGQDFRKKLSLRRKESSSPGMPMAERSACGADLSQGRCIPSRCKVAEVFAWRNGHLGGIFMRCKGKGLLRQHWKKEEAGLETGGQRTPFSRWCSWAIGLRISENQRADWTGSTDRMRRCAIVGGTSRK